MDDDPELASFAVVLAALPPQFDGEAWWQLAILVVALILCGVASAAETALTSVSRVMLKSMAEEGDERARKIEALLAEPTNVLTTILVVHSVALIVAASMATMLALRISQSWGEVIATILLSFVALIFSEMIPKTAVIQNPLRWARVLVGPVLSVSWLLQPIVLSLTAITTALIRLLGGQVKRKSPFVTEEELRLLVTIGEEEGSFEEEKTEMIHSIFEFADTAVREVMVPRIDMVTLPSDATVIEAVDVAMEGGFSRIPVYEAETGVDEIIGVLYTKDMLKQLREGHRSFPIRDLVRPAYFVPESKKLDDLLREIRQKRVHIVIVVDEYGSVAGLVTIEDLVEEIIGDIKDEYDHEENLYEKINEREYIFDAKISIYDFGDMMDIHVEEGDYDTLGGFVYARLDKIPNEGDTVTYKDLTFTILATRGRRITKIRVERNDGASDEDEKSEVSILPVPAPEEPGEESGEKVKQPSKQSSHYEYRGV